MRRAIAVFAAMMLLATGAAVAKAVLRHYAGHTTQGAVVTATADKSHVGYRVSFTQSCETPKHKPLGSHTSGSFGFSRRLGVRLGHKGRFGMRYRQGRTGVKHAKQYFTAVYTVDGHITANSAGGTFRAISKYYASKGRELGICDTGQLKWLAART